MTVDSSHLFWITSRAAGTAALVLASTAVGFGLIMGGRLVKSGVADRRNIHQILSLSAIVAVCVHGLALVGDTWLHASVLDVTVPFVSSYRTVATSIGIISGWALIVLGLSYYVRHRIGPARWRIIHRFTAVAWIFGLVHTFSEGSDAGKLWFIALVVLTAAPALLLLLVRHARWLRPRRRPQLMAVES